MIERAIHQVCLEIRSIIDFVPQTFDLVPALPVVVISRGLQQ